MCVRPAITLPPATFTKIINKPHTQNYKIVHASLVYTTTYIIIKYTYDCVYILFTVPIPLVQITTGNETLGNLTIGDPLTLDCTVTAVRGISSSVDIIWTTGGRVVGRVDNITADIENDSAIYTDSFEISSLSAIDNGREYQCTVVINTSQPVNSSDQITLIFSGDYICTYYVKTMYPWMIKLVLKYHIHS